MTEHTKHWDPAVVQLIEQARAEGAAEVVARVEALLADGPDTWSGYESRDTGWTFLQESVLDFTADLRAAMTSDWCDYMVCPPTLESPEEYCDEPTELGERYCTYHLDLTDD